VAAFMAREQGSCLSSLFDHHFDVMAGLESNPWHSKFTSISTTSIYNLINIAHSTCSGSDAAEDTSNHPQLYLFLLSGFTRAHQRRTEIQRAAVC
jgi:hypothetical protein